MLEIDDTQKTAYRYPINMVAGILPTFEALKGMLTVLQADGITLDDLTLFCGPRGADILDKEGDRGPTWRVRRFVQQLGDEHQQLARYDADLRRGHYLLLVPAEELGKEELAELFRQHSGSRVTSFGRFVIENL